MMRTLDRIQISLILKKVLSGVMPLKNGKKYTNNGGNMEFRKFLMDELAKVTKSLQKYEDKFLDANTTPEQQEFLKTSIEYYRAQAQDLRKQIFETRGTTA
jgi:flagellar hook-basal body complex protein FliE